MYVPESFNPVSADWIPSFIRTNPFALLICSGDGSPLATHLPIISIPRPGVANGLELYFHLARANPQSARIANERCLVVFHGAHAYIYRRNTITLPRRSLPGTTSPYILADGHAKSTRSLSTTN